MGIAIPFQFSFVSREQIEVGDETFCVSFPHPEETNSASITRCGLVQPLWLWPREGRFAVVDGFRRLAVAARLKMTSLPACIVDAHAVKPAVCFLAMLEANHSGRGLNIVEQACGIRKLAEDFGMPESELLASVLPRFGFESSRVELRKLLTLGQAARELQEHIVGCRIPPTFAFQLAGIPLESQRAVARLFSELPCSLGKQRDLVNLIEELARREHTTVERLIEQTRSAWQPATAEDDGAKRVQRLRQELNERRYPMYHETEAAWTSARRQLGLPPKIALSHPPYFEGDQLTVSFNFRRPQELRVYAEKLLEAAAKPDLIALLNCS